jgi:ketosteroid isomerase-like protein
VIAVSREDVEVVRAIFERWERGEPALELFHPDIDWSTPHPDGAGIRGRDEVGALLRAYAGTFRDYRIRLDEIRDLGDHRIEVRFSESGRGKGSGAETELTAVGVWTIRDGRAVAFRAEIERG